MNRIIPRKRRRLNTTKLPWWSSELRHLRNIVRKARKRFLRSKSQQDKENLKQLETRYNDCQAASFRSYIDRIELNLKDNPSSFWTFVKNRKNCIPEQMKYRELSADSSEESANLFADFYSSVNNPNSPELSDGSRQGIPTHDITLPSFNFTQLFLRECAESLKLPICLLFNRSLHERKFPAIWKTASITPIHKSGCRNSVENYRGISILCCIAKVFESMVHSVLYKATRHLISDYQQGFSKKRSTVSNLMCYTNYHQPKSTSGCSLL
ncbi:uncharacterized protein LOC129741360 [Uranotaenia lowii]|uniref:uncharacterized protein LOC129741360 n=1 Tax=Uranotaenia lowii TaxID=190385 RepID=UPI002479594D|nr:uncharacterized protein LOC129741360 [Uranotaenia lowii]